MTQSKPVSSRRARPRTRNTITARPTPSAPSGWLSPRIIWSGAAILVALLIAYAPALHGEFVWDDDAHVTRPELRTLYGLWRIWFDVGATQQSLPAPPQRVLAGTPYLGQRGAGLSPRQRRAPRARGLAAAPGPDTAEIPGAPLAAAIFALHPVHVESVAWISEQKNTLSLAFYLGALAVYLRFAEGRRRSLYVGASALFVLGLLTKTVVATLPGALLLIFWWRAGQLSWRRDVVPLLPWFAAGAAAGLVTAWFERHLLAAEGADFAMTFGQRSVLAGRVLWFYVGKLLWPSHLSFIYARWTIDAVWPPIRLTLVTIGIVAAFWWTRDRSRAPLAAALFFIGSLFPVLGFLNVYPFVFSFVADHFQYAGEPWRDRNRSRLG